MGYRDYYKDAFFHAQQTKGEFYQDPPCTLYIRVYDPNLGYLEGRWRV